jgi:peroxiredoxin Q/BCP
MIHEYMHLCYARDQNVDVMHATDTLRSNIMKHLACTLLGTALLFAAGCSTTSGPSPDVIEGAAAAGSPMVGLPAPDFTLANAAGGTTSLAGLRGKWVVLYFYPENDTPGCTCEATEFTALLSRFQAQNAEVIGVSADSPESHRTFAKKYDLRLTLLSDPDHKTMEAYGAWVIVKMPLNSYGRVIRSTFIIDPEGVIRHHWPEVIPEGHAERVRRALLDLQAAPARQGTSG